MKNTLIIFVFALLCLCGCTQYNGHIGPIFGSWSLVSISEDGSLLQMEGETVFSFQNEIVQVIKRGEPPMLSIVRYGNFVRTDDTLTLKFQLNPTENGNYLFLIPNWLYFPLDESSLPMVIKRLDGSKMVLELYNGTRKITYSFEKTW